LEFALLRAELMAAVAAAFSPQRSQVVSDGVAIPVLGWLAWRILATPARHIRESAMKTHYTIAMAMLAGFGLGTVAVQGLHAQAKVPVYQVTEVEILYPEAYAKDYVPKARAAITAAGGKFLAVGGKTTSFEGDPPKSRIVIQQWDSIESIKAYRDSAAFKELMPIRSKIAKFRAYAVEGIAQ
jgi:uncharacterized protein (DUF1330 family)